MKADFAAAVAAAAAADCTQRCAWPVRLRVFSTSAAVLEDNRLDAMPPVSAVP